METEAGSEYVALAAKVEKLIQACARLNRGKAQLRAHMPRPVSAANCVAPLPAVKALLDATARSARWHQIASPASPASRVRSSAPGLWPPAPLLPGLWPKAPERRGTIGHCRPDAPSLATAGVGLVRWAAPRAHLASAVAHRAQSRGGSSRVMRDERDWRGWCRVWGRQP